MITLTGYYWIQNVWHSCKLLAFSRSTKRLAQTTTNCDEWMTWYHFQYYREIGGNLKSEIRTLIWKKNLKIWRELHLRLTFCVHVRTAFDSSSITKSTQVLIGCSRCKICLRTTTSNALNGGSKPKSVPPRTSMAIPISLRTISSLYKILETSLGKLKYKNIERNMIMHLIEAMWLAYRIWKIRLIFAPLDNLDVSTKVAPSDPISLSKSVCNCWITLSTKK